MKRLILFLFVFICACAPAWHAPSDFISIPINAGKYTIATFQRVTDNISPIHIYVEVDGNSFNAHGHPTSNPTPRGMLMRHLAMRDPSPNVVYMARPCQYIMSNACTRSDWTIGRFSTDIVDSVATAIKDIATNRPVVLIGYSGGAMITGLVINKNPDIDVREWITIAGVLNHVEWTGHFGDVPLSSSLNLDELPRVAQRHYIARGDRVVPNKLSQKWLAGQTLYIIDGATHSDFPNLQLF
ncbi:MAG: hypothetical protein Q4C08_01080 [Pseudomonadota bacterium]|nr:hypothetical protein [Pseudomonadota bacterium]